MKKFYFLSGLPRSGSTLLSAILNQNPSIYSSPTSGLIDMLGSVIGSWSQKQNEVQGRKEEEIYSILRGIVENKYSGIDKDLIIDKSRGWTDPQIISTMTKSLGYMPKIIATVRNVDECASSFVRIANPDNVKEFVRNSGLIDHLKQSYISLFKGYSKFPQSIHFVDYDDLVTDPKKTLNSIHDFLEIPRFNYNFDHVDGSIVAERDEEVWGIKNLHKIRNKIEKKSKDPSDVLGNLRESFMQPRFWKGETESKKGDLDKQLDLALKGKLDKAWELAKKIEEKKPDCDRSAFNRGWFLMSKGNLLDGQKLLDRGRFEGVFGNPKPPVEKPIWDGNSKGRILLYLEGGLGDQIIHFRWVNEILERGCSVIVACDPQIFCLFSKDTRISVVSHSATPSIFYDYWVPSMSMITVLGFEYDDLSGSAYIESKPRSHKNRRFKIGLRWSGNPQFEHEQHRRFPPGYLFDALQNLDADFISLQRDNDEIYRPSWVKAVELKTWEHTKREIEGCDLIITSCTSVAHLSSSMGKPTWIIVPILPYYLWSLPGEKTPWYNSVKLYRQKKYGDWESPFKKIKKDIKDEIRRYNKNSR